MGLHYEASLEGTDFIAKLEYIASCQLVAGHSPHVWVSQLIVQTEAWNMNTKCTLCSCRLGLLCWHGSVNAWWKYLMLGIFSKRPAAPNAFLWATPLRDCCIARLMQHSELGASKLRVEWSSLRTYVVLFIPNNIRHDIPAILKNIFVSQDVFCFTLSFNYQSNPFDIICPHFNKLALLALYMYDMLHMCCIWRFRLWI